MEINEFSQLPQNEKYDTLCLEAEFIVNVWEGSYGYNLFSLDGFFVEMRVSINNNRVIDIMSFHSSEMLNKYLIVLDINSFNC